MSLNNFLQQLCQDSNVMSQHGQIMINATCGSHFDNNNFSVIFSQTSHPHI